MSDLIERLRTYADPDGQGDMMLEAADTIATLSAAKERIGHIANDLQAACDKHENTIATLTAERDKLVRWRALAQECTPGGSEYMDPDVVREVFQRNKREMVEAKLAKAKAEKAVATLIAERDNAIACRRAADARAEAAEARAARLEELLREIAGTFWSATHSHDAAWNMRDIARTALAQETQP